MTKQTMTVADAFHANATGDYKFYTDSEYRTQIIAIKQFVYRPNVYQVSMSTEASASAREVAADTVVYWTESTQGSLRRKLQRAKDALNAIKNGNAARRSYLAKYKVQREDDGEPLYMQVVYDALYAIEETDDA